jgi:hypothetical protein
LGILAFFSVSPTQYFKTFVSTDQGKTWFPPAATEEVSGLRVVINAPVRATFTFAGPSAQP